MVRVKCGLHPASVRANARVWDKFRRVGVHLHLLKEVIALAGLPEGAIILFELVQVGLQARKRVQIASPPPRRDAHYRARPRGGLPPVRISQPFVT
jgi:hypothetical protein